MLRYFLLFFLVAECFGGYYERAPIVRSPAGTFRGKVQRSPQGRPYNSFRGIPFAIPPVGDLRFAKAQPLPKLKGIFDATAFGPICIQPVGEPDRGEEDCLTLNVFTPSASQLRSSIERRPYRFKGFRRIEKRKRLRKVLIFVYGGAFILGGSRDFVPGQLVSRGDIVVVTINYRLGFLGFLRGNTEELPGNQGFSDVILGLKWVKDNIQDFGGDPDDVTLSGQSAGAATVAFLAISPAATGLFNKGIFFSCPNVSIPAIPQTSNDFLALADETFGCNVGTNGSPEDLDVDAVTQCLKSLPAEVFDTPIKIQNLFYTSGDEIFPRSPVDLLSDPEFLESVGYFSRDYLVSVTKDDGYVSVNSEFVRVNLSNPDQADAKYSELFDLPVSVIKNLFQPYRDLFPGDDERALTRFFTDNTITLATEFFKVFPTAPEGATLGDSYLISFDYMPGYIRDMLAFHGIELVYLFDLTPQQILDLYYRTLRVLAPFTETDELVEKSFVDLISDFVKSGDPGITLSENFNVDWPPWNPQFKPYLSFTSCPEVKEDLASRRLFADEAQGFHM